jgi:hypothetical protein
MTKEIAYRKPKPLAEFAAAHTQGSLEHTLFHAVEVLGVPLVIIEEATGLSTAELRRIVRAEETVDPMKRGRVDLFIASMEVAQDLGVLPTKDYGVVRNIVALCFTVKKLEYALDDAETAN